MLRALVVGLAAWYALYSASARLAHAFGICFRAVPRAAHLPRVVRALAYTCLSVLAFRCLLPRLPLFSLRYLSPCPASSRIANCRLTCHFLITAATFSVFCYILSSSSSAACLSINICWPHASLRCRTSRNLACYNAAVSALACMCQRQYTCRLDLPAWQPLTLPLLLAAARLFMPVTPFLYTSSPCPPLPSSISSCTGPHCTHLCTIYLPPYILALLPASLLHYLYTLLTPSMHGTHSYVSTSCHSCLLLLLFCLLLISTYIPLCLSFFSLLLPRFVGPLWAMVGGPRLWRAWTWGTLPQAVGNRPGLLLTTDQEGRDHCGQKAMAGRAEACSLPCRLLPKLLLPAT